MDINKLMKQAQQMQSQVAEAQAALKSVTVEASTGGGKVKVVANAHLEVQSVHIDPEVVDPDDAEPDTGPVITTFIFQVRNIPAALYKALGGFATNGVNMTKLESYMVGGNFFATQFYADVEGHPEDRNLVLALEELSFFSKEMKVLGVYPAHAFRETFPESGD